MPNDEAILRLRKLLVNAIHGKKRHFNAAARKHRRANVIAVVNVLFNVVLGSYLVGYAAAQFTWLEWWVAIFALVPVVLSGVQALWNDDAAAEGHGRIGAKYLAVLEAGRTLLAHAKDGTIGDKELQNKLEKLVKQYAAVSREARSHPTSRRDYKAAQKGIEAGEETYTPEDLASAG